MKLKTTRRLGYLVILGLGLYVAYMNHVMKMPKTITEVSQKYLGSHYTEDPLGEGKTTSHDTDPLIRFDTFDDKTFVETIIAERMAKTNNEFVVKYYLNKIRYFAGNIGFQSRNHLFSADWIPNNSWFLRRSLFAYEKERSALIDRSKWFSKTQDLILYESTRNISIDYIPFEKIDEFDLEDESVVFIIRDFGEDKSIYGTDLLVSHVGFALRRDEDLKMYFRHASEKRQVILDEPFIEYLNELKIKDPKFLGIAVYTLSR